MRSWSVLTLRFQIAVASAALLSLIIFLTAAINVINLQDDLHDNLLNRSMALAKSLSSPLSYDLVSEEYDAIETTLLNAAEFSEINSLKLTDLNGGLISYIIKNENKEILVSYDDSKKTDVIHFRKNNLPSSYFSEKELIIWFPLKTSVAVGWLNLTVSYEKINELSDEIIINNVLAALFIVFANMLFLFLVLTKPTRQIRHAVKIAQQLDAEAPAKTEIIGESKELGQLFSALNEAATRLEEQHSRILVQTESLQKSQQVAEKANKAKSEFLSSMSHELRTPLNSILGFAQLFQYDKNLADEYKEKAQHIYQAGNHLLALINEVLDLSQIESGEYSLSIEVVDVDNVIEECKVLALPLAREKGVDLQIESGLKHEIYIKADSMKLKQVLLNLISNAIKYNKKGGHVRIYYSLKNNVSLRINVEDSGAGIAEQDLDKLFLPFNRLGEAMGTIEGTGIGLVISKKLTEIMGGVIGLASHVGKGSTFWLQFELLSVVKSLSNITEKEPKKITPENNYSARILVAEDNPVNQMILQQLLEMLSLNVQLAADGEEAWQIYQEQEVDILLTDINMPKMDGYELVKKIREHEQQTGKRLPIVAVTANAMKKDKQHCLESGMDAFVSKPVEFDQIQAVIEKWLPVK